MSFYMATRLAKSAVLIGSMVLSNDSNSDRHPQCQSVRTLRFSKRVFGPPRLAKMVFYMSKSRPESAVFIGATVLSNDSNSYHHRSAHRQFAPTPSPPVDS
jgi:hypothetical protein